MNLRWRSNGPAGVALARAEFGDSGRRDDVGGVFNDFKLTGHWATLSGSIESLAPQDQKLRWMAVRQLLLDGKADDAKRALAPSHSIRMRVVRAPEPARC
jgi:hypothetical protein